MDEDKKKSVDGNAASEPASKSINEILQNIVSRVKNEESTVHRGYSRMHHRHSRS